MPTYITTQVRTYNNRRLKAGDPMPGISRRDGEMMVKLGRAQRMPDALVTPVKPSAPVMPPVPAAIVTPESEVSESTPSADALTVAREDYESIVGKRWFHAWDEVELRRRIAEHQDAGSS